METLINPNKYEECLIIAVGTQKETKLLRVSSIKSGITGKAGEIIANETIKLLDKWNCKDSIKNIVFDTTASNTGHISSACIKIQESLQCHLLWSGCRHHIGEIILSQVFTDLKVETTRSPDITLFLCYRKHFEILPQKYHRA